MKTRFGTDGNAFSQLAYEYMTDPNLGVTKDGPECQLNYVIVIGDGMWQHHDRAIAQIKALRTETAAAGVNKDEFGVAHGVKTIFIAYGGGIKDREMNNSKRQQKLAVVMILILVQLNKTQNADKELLLRIQKN